MCGGGRQNGMIAVADLRFIVMVPQVFVEGWTTRTTQIESKIISDNLEVCVRKQVPFL